MAIIDFPAKFVPCEPDLLRVNDHDMIAGIKMGCEGRLVFAP